SLWWKWVAPTNGQLVVDVQSTYMQPVMAVYKGSTVSTLPLMARSSVGWLFPTGVLGVSAIGPEEPTNIAFAAWAEQSGPIEFRISESPAPVNDDFAGRLTIQGLPASDPNPVLFELCTREPGEPHHPDEPGASTAWWTWTAPKTTTVRVPWGTA